MIQDQPPVVFVIHPGGLGDVLLALPALAALRRRYEGHLLALLAGPEVGVLLKACGIIDRTFTMNSGNLAALFAGRDDVAPPLRQVLQACVRVIGWLRDTDGTLELLFRRAFAIPDVTIASPTPCAGVHQSLRFFEVIGERRMAHGEPVSLTLPSALRDAGATALGVAGVQDEEAFVVCHPGSGSPHKCLSADRMAALINHLQTIASRVVLVGGPADSQVVGQLRERIPGLLIVQHQDLTTMAGLLSRSSLFVGHDSGLTHLAAVLRVPTVALFGPTRPDQWAPLGLHVRVVTGPHCTCLTWQHVRRCELKHCLSISLEDVRAACRSMIRYRQVTKY